MLTNFTRIRVFILRDVMHPLQEGQVDVGIDIALCSGKAVPVPDAAEVTGFVDDPDTVHADITKRDGGLNATQAAADDAHFDVLRDRLAFGGRRPRISYESLGIVVLVSVHILLVTLRPKSLLALAAVLLAKGIRIETELLMSYRR